MDYVEKKIRMIIWYPPKLVFVLFSILTLPIAWLIGISIKDIKKQFFEFMQVLLLKKTFWEVFFGGEK